MVRSAIFVLAVAACSDLPPYQPECGNGVIDPHEDCDAKDGCFQCSLACNFDGSTSGCPDGLACGGDGLCHAPGGAFRTQGPVLPFAAHDLFVTDLDRDRVGDVVGIGATSLSIHHGVLYQGPGSETALQTPFVTGTPAVGHLDGNDPTSTDTSLDVALPTADGFLAYSAPQGVLSPYPFALDVSGGSDAVPYALMTIDGRHQALIIAGQDRHLHFATVSVDDPQPDLPGPVICSDTMVTAALEVDLVQYDAGTPTTTDVDVGLTLHDGTQTSGCVFSITQSMGKFVVTDLLQAPAVTRVVLAATTPFTQCPSAIDTVLGGMRATYTEVPPTGSPGACGLNIPAAHSIDLGLGTGADEIAVGGVRLAPALNGYGIDALATSFGVYAITNGSAQRLYRADRADPGRAQRRSRRRRRCRCRRDAGRIR